LIGLFIGILSTSIVQSSSATTSIVVGMVAAGTLSLQGAVPIIMGANMGTTVTNIIVSLGHITRPTEFRRAFAGATVHDFFNMLSVIVLLPLEIMTGYLKKSAEILQSLFADVGGLNLLSPVKALVKPVVDIILHTTDALISGKTATAVVCLVIAFVLLFFALARLTKIMKVLMVGRVERLLHDFLFVNQLRSFIFGIIITAIIQSSSVVTSLAVPLVAAGIITVEQVFPFTLGSNIGTTITAILAALVTQNPVAISAAFVHLLFNVSGIIIWFPLKVVPISMAKGFSSFIAGRRYLAIIYVIVMFYGVPLLLALLTKK